MTEWSLVTMVVLLAAALVQPHRARCPAGWWIDGVRPSGAFACRAAPVRDTGARTEVDDGTPDAELGGQLYCSGGTQPIVVDERTVGCQPGGWR